MFISKLHRRKTRGFVLLYFYHLLTVYSTAHLKRLLLEGRYPAGNYIYMCTSAKPIQQILVNPCLVSDNNVFNNLVYLVFQTFTLKVMIVINLTYKVLLSVR
jgi:hypothetical protein